jgi:hypothetical protein
MNDAPQQPFLRSDPADADEIRKGMREVLRKKQHTLISLVVQRIALLAGLFIAGIRIPAAFTKERPGWPILFGLSTLVMTKQTVRHRSSAKTVDTKLNLRILSKVTHSVAERFQ